MRRCPPCAALAPVLALLLALPACSAGESAAAWTVTDSAGVEIVANHEPPPRWALSAEPLLSLGVVDEGGPTEFFRVHDIELLGDGGFAVANAGTEEIRFFAADGAYRGRTGGRGRGPEEFRGLSMIRAFGDSLLTYDGGNDRLSIRGLDGSYARSFQLEWFGSLLTPVDLLGERGVLAVTVRHMAELDGSALVVDTALVSHYDLEGGLIDSLLHVPHNQRVVRREGDLRTTLSTPFSVHAQIVGTPEGLCLAHGPVAEIRCHHLDGRMHLIVKAPLEPRPVHEQHVAQYWDEELASAGEARADAMRRMGEAMVFPEHFPAFERLEGDPAGRLWARVYALPGEESQTWLVFADGRAVGRLISPRGFRIMDFGEDRLAGVWTDELGVEFVRVYGLEGS